VAMRQHVRGRDSASTSRVWAVVVGVSSSLGAAAVVVSVAAGGPSSASHLTALTAPVASSTMPLTTLPRAITNAIPDQGTAPTVAGSGLHPALAGPPVATVPRPSTKPAVPHFDTPQAAMTYLAAAWNARDAVALGHVTNPGARAELDAMHSEAVNLRLDHCDPRPQGDYMCYFHHDYPSRTSSASASGGLAVFLVGPALNPGWYMTVVQSCG
jgi:hypothetical protein